ncbi:MAG TPA: hypothetical protein VHK88_09450, partial [Aquihabitans sp.]|nr:hypothetical protein [Aquihabitans sp.]
IDEAELDDANDRVQRINLTIDDLPEGWVAEAPIEEVTSVVTECTEYGVDENVVAKAASDRFSLIVDQGGLGLDTTSGYLESVETAEMLMGELGSTDFADCATEQLLSAEGVTVEGQLNQFDGMPELGDEVVALQGDFAMSDTSGASVQLSAIIVAIRTDQVITTVSATAVDTPGDEQLLYQVLDLVAERQEG